MPFMLSDFVSGAKGMQEYRDLQEANQAKKDLAKLATEAATPTTTEDTRGLAQSILPGESGGIPTDQMSKMMTSIPGTETPKEGLTGLGGMQQGISGVEPTPTPAGAKESPLKMILNSTQKSGQELSSVQKQIALNEKYAKYFNDKGQPALANEYIKQNQAFQEKQYDLEKKHFTNQKEATAMLGGQAGAYVDAADDPTKEPMARAELIRQAQELGNVPPERIMQMATMPAPQLKAMMDQTRQGAMTAYEQASSKISAAELALKSRTQTRLEAKEKAQELKGDRDFAAKQIGAISSMLGKFEGTPPPEVQAAAQEGLKYFTSVLHGDGSTTPGATAQPTAPADATTQPSATTASEGSSYLARRAKIESGGDYSNKSTTSSASGAYQITRDTFNNLQSKYKDLPQIAFDELTKKGNEKVQDAYAERLLKDNDGQIQAAGIPVTDKMRDVFWHFGSEDAKDLLTAPNSASVSSVLGSKVIDANKAELTKDGKPITVGELRTKMGVDKAPEVSSELTSTSSKVKLPVATEEANKDSGSQWKLKAKSTGVINQRLAWGITEAFQQSAINAMNIADMPSTSMLGAFSGMAGKSNKDITSSVKGVLSRQATPDEERAFQQEVAGFESNMARALGGGYANSSAKAVMDSYHNQVAQSGDSPIIQANFLARIKQELTSLNQAFKSHPGANDEERKLLQDLTNQLESKIKFNVSDVNAVLRATTGKESVAAASAKIAGPAAKFTYKGQEYIRPTTATDDSWAKYKAYIQSH